MLLICSGGGWYELTYLTKIAEIPKPAVMPLSGSISQKHGGEGRYELTCQTMITDISAAAVKSLSGHIPQIGVGRK